MYQYLLLDMLPGYHWFRVHSCVFYLHSQAIWRVSFKSGFVPCSPQESLAYLVQRITYTTNHIYNESHIQWISLNDIYNEWHVQWMTYTMNDMYNEWHIQHYKSGNYNAWEYSWSNLVLGPRQTYRWKGTFYTYPGCTEWFLVYG